MKRLLCFWLLVCAGCASAPRQTALEEQPLQFTVPQSSLTIASTHNLVSVQALRSPEDPRRICVEARIQNILRTGHRAGHDTLAFPIICVLTNDPAPHYMSLDLKKPAQTGRPLPWTPHPMKRGDLGTQLMIQMIPGSPPGIGYTVDVVSGQPDQPTYSYSGVLRLE